jgi:hypothetical protein
VKFRGGISKRLVVQGGLVKLSLKIMYFKIFFFFFFFFFFFELVLIKVQNSKDKHLQPVFSTDNI